MRVELLRTNSPIYDKSEASLNYDYGFLTFSLLPFYVLAST